MILKRTPGIYLVGFSAAGKTTIGAWADGRRRELKRDGIHAITVRPESMRRGRRLAISARECAEAIARGVERGSRMVVTPRSGWLFILAERLLPSLVEYRLERMQGGQP